jgi:transketolase
MRDAFINSLLAAAEIDETIFLVVGDLGYGVIEQFEEKFPERFLNSGISEQSMMGVAAGLAKSGYKVFVYSIANFPTMRCLEQIRNDVCYHSLDVTIVSIGAGFGYGTLGYSHFAIEDLALIRVLPNIMVYSPGDALELDVAVKSIVENKGPSYLRVGKNGESLLSGGDFSSPLKARRLSEGQDFAVLSTGNIGAEVQIAIEGLPTGMKSTIGHFSIPTLHQATLQSIELDRFRKVITVEEHILSGGFGSFVLEYLESEQIHVSIKRLGITKDLDFPIGDQKYLRKIHGLDAESMRTKIQEFFG